MRETGLEVPWKRPYHPLPFWFVKFGFHYKTSLSISYFTDRSRIIPLFFWLGHRLGHSPQTLTVERPLLHRSRCTKCLTRLDCNMNRILVHFLLISFSLKWFSVWIRMFLIVIHVSSCRVRFHHNSAMMKSAEFESIGTCYSKSTFKVYVWSRLSSRL